MWYFLGGVVVYLSLVERLGHYLALGGWGQQPVNSEVTESGKVRIMSNYRKERPGS